MSAAPRTGGPEAVAIYGAAPASAFELRPLSKTELGFVRFTLFSMLAASSYHQQQPASQQNAAQQTVSPPSTVNPSDTQQHPANNGQPPQPFQSVLRLHDDPAQPTPPAPKPSRKRKTPPSAQEQQPPPQPPPPVMHPPPGVMPPPPAHLMHPPHMGPPPPLPFQYIPQDYTPGGLTHPPPLPPGHQGGSPPQDGGAGRPLSQSKRAEQNRKAQRAFRERRDQ